jgi:hypothetical protein
MELAYIETHLVDHCNLNCKGCYHFSPLSKKNFIVFNTFKKDFQRLRTLFDDIKMIRLMGGEPLLHPDLQQFLECARYNFPNSTICLVTNGILLNNQKDAFWKTCNRNNIVIQVTSYPIKLNIDSVKEKTERFQARLELSSLITHFGKNINANGDSDPTLSFRNCRLRFNCPNLRDGNVYLCWFTPLVHIFSDFFKKRINIEKSDYINIHEDISAYDIFEFLRHPTPMCKWCLYDWPYDGWEISKKSIIEWIGYNPTAQMQT